ncbi:MAG: hypothetical protein AUK47_19465 [Deltaproteobacteria bacterium CG2_30_63_29]|nr:MAG: hypothetical protein AUK47_19465 [Deltaproteobacteria bacterium CG2_30_63_29]PJB49189.1 MAG: hypothetical protein CO108_00715 [Deltaproteobacteria bacterium CG_4_9_14_3_um_filter_63_12]
MRRAELLLCIASVLLATACGTEDQTVEPIDYGPNPFTEVLSTDGKADTAYLNPDGVEVEVDIEADIIASNWQRAQGPAYLGQFAMTYLRARKIMYLESLAEDSSSKERVEWLVDGTWMTAGSVGNVDTAKLTHFRIVGINAVLLNAYIAGVDVGKVFKAPVPKAPYTIMGDAGDTCAEADGHMSLSQSIYWYMWDPEKAGCKAELQDMTITVSKLFAKPAPRYPEYDRLIADKKVTAVVLFGQIGDELNDNDTGVRGLKTMATWLEQGGFKKAATAPVGVRYVKHIGEVDFEIDLYSPYEFSGLSDMAHFSNFNRAIKEHEIVVYDGHSMLGASDFWSRPEYPDTYQIFLYGGCLGYEYYLRPILDAKGGWDNLDIMSSVVEVSADANRFAGPVLADIAKALEGKYDISWNDMLGRVRARVYDSTFGASGVRDNCFTPNGSRCGAPVDPAATVTVDGKAPIAIPDNDAAGASASLTVAESFVAAQILLQLEVEHTWVGDLVITLEHKGVTETIWDKAGASAQSISGSFTVESFKDVDVQGDWTLKVVDTAKDDAGSVVKWGLVLER